MPSDLVLEGVYVPLITPFAEDGSVATGEIESLCEGYLADGASGIVALGTTGEPATLTDAEKSSVIEAVVRVCRPSDATVIVGAGSNNTATSLDAVRNLGDIEGVDALMSVVPYYTRPSEAGIVEHFKALAAGSRVPLIVYNVPYRTGRGLGAESLLELARTPNIAGLKQAVGGVDTDSLAVLSEKPDDFAVLCGDDPFLYSLMCLGASGGIAASAHVCTDRFVELVKRARNSEFAAARQIAERLLGVCTSLFSEPSPSVTKGVLARQGRISTPDLRLPMTRASEAAVTAAFAEVAAASSLT